MRNEEPVALINRAKHILMAEPERTSGTKTVTECTLCSHASCKHEDAWLIEEGHFNWFSAETKACSRKINKQIRLGTQREEMGSNTAQMHVVLQK